MPRREIPHDDKGNSRSADPARGTTAGTADGTQPVLDSWLWAGPSLAGAAQRVGCSGFARRLCCRSEHLSFLPPIRLRLHKRTSCESKRFHTFIAHSARDHLAAKRLVSCLAIVEGPATFCVCLSSAVRWQPGSQTMTVEAHTKRAGRHTSSRPRQSGSVGERCRRPWGPG
jgi:hypothetical protein